MGIVFYRENFKPTNKRLPLKESSISQRRVVKPLTLRNRIFLSSLPVFNKNS